MWRDVEGDIWEGCGGGYMGGMWRGIYGREVEGDIWERGGGGYMGERWREIYGREVEGGEGGGGG